MWYCQLDRSWYPPFSLFLFSFFFFFIYPLLFASIPFPPPSLPSTFVLLPSSFYLLLSPGRNSKFNFLNEFCRNFAGISRIAKILLIILLFRNCGRKFVHGKIGCLLVRYYIVRDFDAESALRQRERERGARKGAGRETTWYPLFYYRGRYWGVNGGGGGGERE